MARLTLGGKILISVIAIGLIGFGAYKGGLINKALNVLAPPKKQSGEISKEDFKNQSSNDISTKEQGSIDTSKGDSNKVLKVGIVTWGGYAGGIVANNGFKPNEDSIFYKKYNQKVELVVIDDFDASRKAFASGSEKGGIDIVWSTVDAYALEYPQMEKQGLNPKAIMQYDWSRGGDAIAVTKNINTIEDLRGKKIAVAKATPSHYFGLWVLSQGGVKNSEVNWIFTGSAPESANLFKAGKVDAAVSWSPDVYMAAESRGKILISTKEATNLIADIFVARGDFLENNPKAVINFLRGWFDGVKEAKANPQKAIRLMSENFQGIGLSDAEGMWKDVYLPDYADNYRFFGLDNKENPTGFHTIFKTASLIWKKVGESNTIGDVNNAVDTRFLKSLEQYYSDELKKPVKKTTFKPINTIQTKKKPVISKKVTVYFQTGSASLDENSKYVIDNEVAQLASTFSDAYIRISGNTDNVGDRTSNIDLSKKRASAVASYLINKYKFDRNKFQIIGNGPDKPIASNNTEEGRAKNRRTDFEVITK